MTTPTTCTFTVQSSDLTPTPAVGAKVMVFVGSAFIAAGTADTSGNLTLVLFPGAYTVEAVFPRWVFPPVAITVPSPGPFTQILIGTNTGIVNPTPPRTVRLFGFCVGQGGAPAADVRVTVRSSGFGQERAFSSVASTSSGVDPQNVALTAVNRELLTDSNGYWECDVIPEAILAVTILELRYRKVFRVPNDVRVTTLNLRDARPDPGAGTEMGVSTDTGSYDRDTNG